jgi:hypothetical protein
MVKIAPRKPCSESKESAHPNAPRRLVSLWQELGCSDRQTAKVCEVNQYYVSQLIRRGIEPTNEDIREKLFLPRKPRKKRAEKPEEWHGQKKVQLRIRKLHRETTKTFKRWRKRNV